MRRTWWTRGHAPILLALSLWAALPAIEWCPFTWEQCRGACDAGAEPADCAGAACEIPCALPCDPEPDPLPLGDRAWCIHPPADGVLARGLEVPAPDEAQVLAGLAETLRVPAQCADLERRVEGGNLRPGLAAAHAPPRVRAPPAA